MFEHLKDYDKILVAGLAGSGTHICAAMVADDLGYEYVDEGQYGGSNWDLFKEVTVGKSKIVVQGPSMARSAMGPLMAEWKKLHIVRPLDEVIASCIRRLTLAAPALVPPTAEGLLPFRARCHELQERLDAMGWETVEYASLSAHPMWLAKEHRTLFTWGQLS